jgi:hypothetical protein
MALIPNFGIISFSILALVNFFLNLKFHLLNNTVFNIKAFWILKKIHFTLKIE